MLPHYTHLIRFTYRLQRAERLWRRLSVYYRIIKCDANMRYTPINIGEQSENIWGSLAQPDYVITCNGLRNWVFLIISFHLSIPLSLLLSLSVSTCVYVFCLFVIHDVGKLFFFFLPVVQIKVNVCDGFCYLPFYRIDFMVNFLRGKSIVLRLTTGPQLLSAGYTYTLLYPYHQHIYLFVLCFCFKIAVRHSFRTGTTVKWFSKKCLEFVWK